MEIRAATKKDIDLIINFQLSMAVETENLVLDREEVSKGVQAIFIDPSKGAYFVAEVERKVVGCCMITYEWSDWRNANIWWLQSLFVQPNWRGRGVFSNIFIFLKDKINKDQKVSGLRLYVDQSNKNAQEIYAHLGMRNDHYSTFEWMKS